MRRQDSNLRPPGYEPDELPTALLRDMLCLIACRLYHGEAGLSSVFSDGLICFSAGGTDCGFCGGAASGFAGEGGGTASGCFVVGLRQRLVSCLGQNVSARSGVRLPGQNGAIFQSGKFFSSDRIRISTGLGSLPQNAAICRFWGFTITDRRISSSDSSRCS